MLFPQHVFYGEMKKKKWDLIKASFSSLEPVDLILGQT